MGTIDSGVGSGVEPTVLPAPLRIVPNAPATDSGVGVAVTSLDGTVGGAGSWVSGGVRVASGVDMSPGVNVAGSVAGADVAVGAGPVPPSSVGWIKVHPADTDMTAPNMTGTDQSRKHPGNI